jgi:hypothetical protein
VCPPRGAPPAAPPAVITALLFSPPGSWLAAGDASGRVTVWDLKEGKALAQWEGASAGGPAHRGAVSALAWHPTELLLASGGADGAAKCWSLEGVSAAAGAGGAGAGAGALASATPSDARAVRGLLWTPAGTLCVINDAGAKAWAVADGARAPPRVCFTAAVDW